MKSNSLFIPSLSGLRGLAALLVVFSHASRRELFPDILGVGAGHMGVMLFFTLSAFLMTTLYLSRQPDPIAMRGFWVARFGRVYPLHFIMLTLGLVAFGIGIDPTIFPYVIKLKLYLENIFLIGRFSVFWTISTEFQFYLLFAIGWVLGHKTGNVRRFMAIVSTLAVFAVFIDVYSYPRGLVFKTIQFFAVGILAGLIYQMPMAWKWGHLCDALLGCLLILFVASLPFPFEVITGFKHSGFWSPWLLFLCSGIVLSAAMADGPVSRALGSRVGILLGNLSFAIYLLHVPVLHAVKYYFESLSTGVKFSIALSITIGLSALVYYLLEDPIRRWSRHRFSNAASKPRLSNW